MKNSVKLNLIRWIISFVGTPLVLGGIEWLTMGSFIEGYFFGFLIAILSVFIEIVLIEYKQRISLFSKEHSKYLLVIGILLVVGPGFLIPSHISRLWSIFPMMIGILVVFLSIDNKE
ncbi:hypothetical protein [Lactococcus petauri]|uniref:hypothetical protein n=1 Tax=Lactococcus petauri TaxID=1940789 RepID=UPI00254FF269|nr:hypothetical protein [Lactococcus petauri]